MKGWLLYVAIAVLPGGVIIAGILAFRRYQAEQQRTDLVPRWRAFIKRDAAEGEPTIPPANVPPVVERKAVSHHDRFRYRVMGRS